MVGEEVSNPPELLDVVLGIGLQCVHHVWELHAVSHKEDREIVAHQVPVAFPAGKSKEIEDQYESFHLEKRETAWKD